MSANGGSGDFYTPTAVSPQSRIPCNLYGFQNTGVSLLPSTLNNAYVGLHSGELIKTRLPQSLTLGTEYQLTYDSSLAEGASTFATPLQLIISDLDSGFGDIPTTWSILNSDIICTNTSTWQKNTIKFITPTTGNPIEFLYIGIKTTNYISLIPGLITCPSTIDYNSINWSYYYIDNVSLVPTYNATLDLPTTLCGSNSLPDLSNFVQNAPPTGVFSGIGVSVNAGNVYSFNPTTSGTYTITYTYVGSPGCPAVTITDTIIFEANCAQPFISQVYAGENEGEMYIEVKNRSNTQSITAGQFFLNNYANGQTFDQTISSIDIGAFAPLEVKVFSGHLAGTGGASPQVSGTIITLPADFAFDGNNDILNISGFYKYQRALDEIVDIAGNSDAWCVGKSLVRSSCAVAYPRIDLFDIDDWVTFSLEEMISPLYDGSSLTNAVLGRHNTGVMRFRVGFVWNEPGLPVNSSTPDRSRQIEIFDANYDTGVQGNSEACSMTVNDFRTLTVRPNTHVSIQIAISINQFGRIDVQNEGNLLMVKDCYNGFCGPDLINLGPSGTMRVTKNTVGLDSSTDYVFWSSPLSNNPINLPANSVQNLFPTPQFNANRFYNFRNSNFFDGFDQSLNPTPAGYDDNDDDFHILDTIERNQLMTPGQGYCNWPPVGTSANYSINFNGQANNGVVTVPLFRNLAFGDNTNLVGNPYPSPIDLDTLFDVNTQIIDPVAFIWGRSNDNPDPSNPGPDPVNYAIDNYMVYNPTGMVVSGPSYPAFNSRGILSSCQSFFVNSIKNQLPTPASNASGTIEPAGNLIFNNSMRGVELNNTFGRGTTPKTVEKDNKIWLNLTDESGNHQSQIEVAFLEKASNKYDPKEDVKAFVGRKLNFYSKASNQDLIIDAQTGFEKNKTIALGITNLFDKDQKLFIAIDKSGGIFKEQAIYLFDKVTSRINNISKENYSFTANKSIIDDRFVLLFDNKVTTDISQNENSNVLVFKNDNVLNVMSLNKKLVSVAVVDIYTPSTSGLFISKSENINNKNFKQ